MQLQKISINAFLIVKIAVFINVKKPAYAQLERVFDAKKVSSCDTPTDPLERMTTVFTGQKPIVEKNQKPKNTRKTLCNHSLSRLKECFDLRSTGVFIGFAIVSMNMLDSRQTDFRNLKSSNLPVNHSLNSI